MERNHVRPVVHAALVALAVSALVACSQESGRIRRSTATTVTTPSATSTAAPTSVAEGATASSTTPDGSAQIPADWNLDPSTFRGRDGTMLTYVCPPAGTASTIWGTEVYTDDSSVCTAAVHVGLITFTEGGVVTIEIAPGAQAYAAGVAHGVTSDPYGPWGGSFTFPKAPPGSGTFTPAGTGDPAVVASAWAATAGAHRGENGSRFTVDCPPAGTPAGVWGSGPYTDDSSVCSAATHAGLITAATGGSVTYEIAPGQTAYVGSTANGVTTTDYGAFPGSFAFPR